MAHGQRCSGSMQHCYYPWYTFTRYQRSSFKLQCDDKSDQVHRIGSHCTWSQFVEEHNDRFCSHEHMKNSEICTHPGDWMKKQRNPIITDPHNCQASCLTPGAGCEACTSPEYYQCPSSRVCIHPDLHCDGHPQCEHGEDEQFDECYQQYIDKGVVEKYATYKCTSALYPGIITIATVCDGVVECLDASDEGSLCSNIDFYSTIFLTSVTITIAVAFIIFRVCCSEKDTEDSNDGEEESMDKVSSLEELLSEYREHHEDLSVVENVNAFLIQTKFTKSRNEISGISVQFLKFERKYHKENESEMFCCIRKKIDPLVYHILFPGLIHRILDKLENSFQCNSISRLLFWLKRNEKLHKAIHSIKTLLVIETHYFDLLKDSFVAISILTAIGGPSSVWNFPGKFSSVVAVLMVATIIFPLMLSCLQLSSTLQTKSDSFLSRLRLQVGIILFSIFCPFLLHEAYESSKAKLRSLSMKKQNKRDFIVDQLRLTRSHKTQFVQFMRVELGLEMFYQVTLQVLLVLLSRTQTPTTGGLQKMFEHTSVFGLSAEVILYLSILWSLRSCIRLHLKSIKTMKGYLPTTTMIIACLWSSAAIVKRILSMTVFFMPSLGLLDILFHWKAEQIPFKIRRAYNNAVNVHLHNLSSEFVLWSDLDRWDHSNIKSRKPPSYALYTGLELGPTFALFLCLMIFHFIAIFMVKHYKARGFKCTVSISKVIHVLENMNFAFNFEDWDEGDFDVEQFQENFSKAQKEIFSLYLVNTGISFISLAPLWITGAQTVLQCD